VPTEQINVATRRGWRELGFFYDRIENNNEWLIRGSRSGLQRFAQLICDYTNDQMLPKAIVVCWALHDDVGPLHVLRGERARLEVC
jgi:hypothetical protein